MKKYFLLFLTTLISLSILAGCNSESDTTNEDITKNESSDVDDTTSSEEPVIEDEVTEPTETETVEEDTVEEFSEPVETDIVEEENEITSSSYSDDSVPDLASADGEDWVLLSNSEKIAWMEEAITIVENQGRIVLEGPEWFVDSLDAFYGDPATNPTKVNEIFAMSGVAGEVIIE